MSPTFPLVTFSLVLSAFIPPSPGMPRSRKFSALHCDYSNQVFRVTDGVSHWEKYVPQGEELREAKLECGQKIAAGLIGSYFVFFTDGKIKSLYLGTFDENRRVIALGDELAAATAGSYFVTAREGGDIVSTFIATPSETPRIAIANHTAATVMGRNFAVFDGTQTLKEFVGGGTDVRVVASGDSAAALTGSYFVAYVGGQFIEKALTSRAPDDQLLASSSLISATAGKSWIVVDGKRKSLRAKRLQTSGALRLSPDGVMLQLNDGSSRSYSTATGRFSQFD